MYDYEKKHLEKLRKHLAECCVLLKSNGAFPLAKPEKLLPMAVVYVAP